jgi:hypothetical protein
MFERLFWPDDANNPPARASSAFDPRAYFQKRLRELADVTEVMTSRETTPNGPQAFAIRYDDEHRERLAELFRDFDATTLGELAAVVSNYMDSVYDAMAHLLELEEEEATGSDGDIDRSVKMTDSTDLTVSMSLANVINDAVRVILEERGGAAIETIAPGCDDPLVEEDATNEWEAQGSDGSYDVPELADWHDDHINDDSRSLSFIKIDEGILDEALLMTVDLGALYAQYCETDACVNDELDESSLADAEYQRIEQEVFRLFATLSRGETTIMGLVSLRCHQDIVRALETLHESQADYCFMQVFTSAALEALFAVNNFREYVIDETARAKGEISDEDIPNAYVRALMKHFGIA